MAYGRWQTGAMPSTTLFLAAFILLASIANAAVLGIDFGTLNIKAVLVKPGIPFEIVLSKDSKRKETAAVAFKPLRDGKNNILAEAGSFPERLYGADAVALQGRFPGEVFPNLKFLLQDAEQQDVVGAYHARYPGVQVSSTEGKTSIQSSAFHETEGAWSVEELLAMELANIRRNAENLGGRGTTVQDAVITIPVFYTAKEKAAISRAAELAGLNVMALISDGLAVGLDYAKSRTFPSINEGLKPEHHIVFDMGAGSTTATLLRFQSRSVKDVGRYNKTIQEVSVLGTGWDRLLGGDTFTQHIVTDFLHKFMTKPVIKSRGVQLTEVESNARLMSRLVKEAEKTRQVLSANTETSSSFEELLPDVDFKTKTSRADFEKLIAEDIAKVTTPITDALEQAKLSINDVDSIILYGGAVRTPAVQRSLEKLAGAAKLKTNVNADESAVFGAALRAASLSPSFKVKEIRISDVAGYTSQLFYSTDGVRDRSQDIFLPSSPAGNNGTTKQISIKQKTDFFFQLQQSGTPFAMIVTQNLTDGVKELHDKFGCDVAAIDTNFSVRLSPFDGLPEVVGGTVSCETDKAAKAKVGDSVKDWLGLGKKKDQQVLEDDQAGPTEQVTASSDSSSSSSSSSSSKSSKSSKTPEKPKKRTEIINIAVKTTKLHAPLSDELARMKERLSDFDWSDKRRLAREESMNVLESYTYYVRDFLTNTDYSTFSTQAQRDAIAKVLQTTRDFMDDPSQVTKATEKTFKEQLAGLKDLVQPILTRRTEKESRPEGLKSLSTALEQTNSMLKMIQEQIQKASDAAKASAASATSVVSSAVSDALDDLEEPDKEEPPALPDLFSAYTETDLTSLQEIYDKVSTWLTGKESEQKKLKEYDDPAFSLQDLEKQAKILSDATLQMMQKKLKLPPRSSSKKASKTKTKSKGKSTSTDASSVTDTPEAKDSAKPSFITVGDGDDMPTEEEILRMVSQAKGSMKSESSSKSSGHIDEL